MANYSKGQQKYPAGNRGQRNQSHINHAVDLLAAAAVFASSKMAFVIAALVLSAVAVFEFARHWLLYTSLHAPLGVRWALPTARWGLNKNHQPMEIGIDSFVAATVDTSGRAVDPARHFSELLEAITLADEVGLDVFGIGEHHRREFSIPRRR